MEWRYEVQPVADERCDTLTGECLAGAHTEAESRRLASQHSVYPYGVGILDTVTGQIDFGRGFGVTIE